MGGDRCVTGAGMRPPSGASAEAADGPVLARATPLASSPRPHHGDGVSADSSKPTHQIPRYLQRQSYRILPVNPRGGELLGEAVARSLAELIPRADGRLVSVEEYLALIEAY